MIVEFGAHILIILFSNQKKKQYPQNNIKPISINNEILRNKTIIKF